MRNTRLPGHRLRDSGRIWYGWPYFEYGTGPGPAICSCGEESPVLPTTAARQRWHAGHKAEMRAKEEA